MAARRRPALVAPLFADRREAGRELAGALESERGPELVVVGLARGGVEVAAAVAHELDAPLDVLAVRKVGHPYEPEYALGAVVPGGGVYLRASDGLTETQLAAAVEEAGRSAAELDGRLHARHPPLDLHGKTTVLVDDGLATGATMVAALRGARAGGADRVVAAVPVGPAESLDLISAEADRVACPYVPERFFAVGSWYRSFPQLDDATVLALVDEGRNRVSPGRAGLHRSAAPSR